MKDTQTGATRRVSADISGAQSQGYSDYPAISADGRYIAYCVGSSSLGSSEYDNSGEIFLSDTVAGTTRRTSAGSNGTPGDGHSGYPAISADGRYATFYSLSANLVSGDTNGVADVFVKDTATGAIRRASTSSSGSQSSGSSERPSISADGRYVAYCSGSSNLVIGDTNGLTDVFVKDMVTGTTRRASTDSIGSQCNGSTALPSISADGRFVAFYSESSNLTADVQGGGIFLKDMSTGQTRRVSTESPGAQRNGADKNSLSISADGRYVAFSSASVDLVSGDTNGRADVFVRDMATGAVRRVSTGAMGEQGNGEVRYSQSISADGRYVAFCSESSNLVSDDTNGWADVFVKDTSGASFGPASNPVTSVADNTETELPVIVLVGGFLSDTGYHPVKKAGATQVAPGWEMNSSRTKMGAPWDFLGDANSKTLKYLGAADVLVMPTAQGAQFWPEAVRTARPVIDSTGALDYNMAALAKWLQSDDVALLTKGRPIILVGHSYGGVIARSMLAADALPRGSDIRKRIKGVVQFASPNGGTPLGTLARSASWAARFPVELGMPAVRDLRSPGRDGMESRPQGQGRSSCGSLRRIVPSMGFGADRTSGGIVRTGADGASVRKLGDAIRDDDCGVIGLRRRQRLDRRSELGRGRDRFTEECAARFRRGQVRVVGHADSRCGLSGNERHLQMVPWSLPA